MGQSLNSYDNMCQKMFAEKNKGVDKYLLVTTRLKY